jgi:hypothetical protein
LWRFIGRPANLAGLPSDEAGIFLAGWSKVGGKFIEYPRMWATWLEMRALALLVAAGIFRPTDYGLTKYAQEWQSRGGSDYDRRGNPIR